MNKFEQAFIKRMAKSYRELHDLSMREAVHKAYEAYDLYKEAEVDIIDEEYRRNA